MANNSQIDDQLSDTSSESNWPVDHQIEGQQHDRVVFENVADQYVKGKDVTAFFTIVQDIKINPEEDQIGILRVGCTNIKECVAYAPVEYAPSTTSGSVRHGTATFSSALLPVTDDEFYQFCYIINKAKYLGSSIPFQLNCEPDDIDLLSNKPVNKTKSDGLIALPDQESDDIIVIHTKSTLTEGKLRQENRQLLDINRRLESKKDEYQAKLQSIESKHQEQMHKLNQDMQYVSAAHKRVTEELSIYQQTLKKLQIEYEKTAQQCEQHQAKAEEYANRCQTFEQSKGQIIQDASQMRAQLAAVQQLTKDQATKIIDLERRLMQASELTKQADQRVIVLEQELRDLRLVSEKYQRSAQGQIEEYARKISQLTDQSNASEITNNLLKDEINIIKDENEKLLTKSEQNQDLIKHLQDKLEQAQKENETIKMEIEKIQVQSNENNVDQQAYNALKMSFEEIKKRCVKHQKNEVEVKKQLTGYQSFIDELNNEIQDLTKRLTDGAEEYKTLQRKCIALEHSIQNNQQNQEQPVLTTNQNPIFEVLCNSDKTEPNTRNSSLKSSLADVDGEVRQCPMCYWEFPPTMNADGKREHIEHHFQ